MKIESELRRKQMVQFQFRAGGVLSFLTGLLLGLAAVANYPGEINLAGAILYYASFVGLSLSIIALHVAQAEHSGVVGVAGFLLTNLGATFAVIPSFLIMAQVAGSIESNDALMASWLDIPLGRIGVYMVVFGLAIFGIGVVRAGVFPSWMGWLVTIGIATYLPTEFFGGLMFQIFWPIGACLAGFGLTSMGWMLATRGK